jgi:predicted Zn-dependent peptidase
VVGDVDPEKVCQIAESVLGTEQKSAGRKIRNWQEQMTVGQDSVRRMEVSMPSFQLGFKCEPTGRGVNAIRQEVIGDLAAEALFGESSGLYLRLYEEGLIDSSFGGGFETVDGCALLTCGGDSEDPYAVRDRILEQARILLERGIEEADFMRMKRSAMGRRIRDLDSFDSTAFRICAYHMADFDYFEFPAVYAQVEIKDVLEFLQRVVQQERCALSVIEPLSE